MKEQNFILQNPVTGQFHQLRGLSPVGAPVALTQKPGGMALYHKTLSEALAFAVSGDTVLLLRDTYEYITLKNGVNLNGNGYSMISTADAPLMTDNGQTVSCEVTNFERIESTFAGGVSEWNALIMLTGTNSNVTVQGKSLITPATGLNWQGQTAKCYNGSTLRLRIKTIKANAVEVGTNARIIVEDGTWTSPMATSYCYQVPSGQKGYVRFNNMHIYVNNCLTFDTQCDATYNRCRITTERNGFIGRAECRYSLIDCQILAQTKASWQAETNAVNQFYSAGSSVELIGTNVVIAKGSAANWIGLNNAGSVQINGLVVSNKPSPVSNFAPTVGTAANGSILIDAAADLKFMQ